MINIETVNIGVVQGRLSRPVSGHIQEFPFDTWEKEFDLLPKLGLSHIEWIVTKESFDKNPIFKKDLSDYPISAICLDNFIDLKYSRESFWKDQITPIIQVLKKWKTPPRIILPFTEPFQHINSFPFSRFCDYYDYDHKFLIEHNFSFFPIKKFPYDVVYDTGNITTSDASHREFISNWNSHINTIHLKDKSIATNKTVFPLTGDTNFPFIFNELFRTIEAEGFDKNKLTFTLQTARGLTGLEQETVYYHKLIFEKLINDYLL